MNGFSIHQGLLAITMPSWLETLFDLAAQFTGGREAAGRPIVWFGIAASYWAILAYIAYTRSQRHGTPREGFLLCAFLFGLSRELFMIVVHVLEALSIVDPVQLHEFFPPVDHLLQNLSIVITAAAFMRFAAEDGAGADRFLKIGIVANAVCYVATFWWWASFIRSHPTFRFGHTWCDMLFHTTMTVLLAWSIWSLGTRTRGWLRGLVCSAMFLLLMFEFLKLPDNLTGEAYAGIYTPIRHIAYLMAIPLLGFIYVRELADELDRSIESERLAALGTAMAGLVHESRNALARNQAGLKLLSRELGDRPELSRYVDESLAAQAEVQSLFERVRDFASPKQLNTMQQNVNDIAKRAWEKAMATHQGCAATLNAETDTDTRCVVDELAIEAVFRNLIENSLDCGADPVVVELQYKEVQLAGADGLQILYRDNGPISQCPMSTDCK